MGVAQLPTTRAGGRRSAHGCRAERGVAVVLAPVFVRCTGRVMRRSPVSPSMHSATLSLWSPRLTL